MDDGVGKEEKHPPREDEADSTCTLSLQLHTSNVQLAVTSSVPRIVADSETRRGYALIPKRDADTR